MKWKCGYLFDSQSSKVLIYIILYFSSEITLNVANY